MWWICSRVAWRGSRVPRLAREAGCGSTGEARNESTQEARVVAGGKHAVEVTIKGRESNEVDVMECQRCSFEEECGLAKPIHVVTLC